MLDEFFHFCQAIGSALHEQACYTASWLAVGLNTALIPIIIIAYSLCHLGSGPYASSLWQVWGGRRRSKAWLQQLTTSTAVEALPGIVTSEQLNAVSPSWPLYDHDPESLQAEQGAWTASNPKASSAHMPSCRKCLRMLFVSPASELYMFIFSMLGNGKH